MQKTFLSFQKSAPASTSEGYNVRVVLFLFVCGYSIYQREDRLELPRRQGLKFLPQLPHLPRAFRGEIEKLHWGHAKVFADIEECGHGRERLPRLNGIDIARALAEGKAHIAGGYAFLHTKLCKSHGKVLLIHSKHLVSNHI